MAIGDVKVFDLSCVDYVTEELQRNVDGSRYFHAATLPRRRRGELIAIQCQLHTLIRDLLEATRG